MNRTPVEAQNLIQAALVLTKAYKDGINAVEFMIKNPFYRGQKLLYFLS